MTPAAVQVHMEKGKKYRLLLHYQAGNYKWVTREMIGVYLGDDAYGAAQFSLRPKLGTTQVPYSYIQKAVESDRPVCAPRPVS